MAQLFDYVDYLSREIGARPAGTEEEQQAALYIAEQFQKDAGFHTEIEEFTSSSNIEGAGAILGVIVIVASILAMLFNMLAIPAFILIVVSAAIYVLEAFDKPFISKALSRGASQNVVSKYQPGGEGASASRGHSRKIILVAHYDSGKVKPGLVSRFESMNAPIGLICVGGMVAAAFFMLLRIFLGSVGGLGIILLNVLTIISLVIVALPVFKALLYRVAPYNEGANNNASGVAALIEVASRVSSGSVSEADLAQISEEISMHGEEAVLESGLIPEGVELDYEAIAGQTTDDMDEFENYSEEERLLAAKAAIAALTGRPVENHVYATIEEHPESDYMPAAYVDEGYYGDQFGGQDVVAPEADFAFDQAADDRQQPVAEEDPSTSTAGFQNAPSWFVAAQKNAKKTDDSSVKVQRSRYSSALDNAEREVENRELARQEEERQRLEAEQRAQEEARLEEQRRAQEARIEQQRREEEARRAAQEALEAAKASQEEPEEAVPAASESQDGEEATALDAAPDSLEAAAPEAEAAAATDAEGQNDAEAQETLVEDEETAAAAPEVDLGSTIAFDPRMMQAVADEGAGEEEQADEVAVAEPAHAPKVMNLPSIDQAAEPSVPHTTNPSRSGMFRKLRTDVPSLSGVIRMQEAGEDVSQKVDDAPVRRVRPYVPQVQEPVQEQPVDYEMEVSLSDDLASAVQEKAAPTAGEAEGANQVAMPSSRAGGFLNRFRSKGGVELEETPQEWLDVDEDFNAREVGKKRGSWESFRDESGTKPSGKWEGGAFSRVRLGHVNMLSGADTDSDVPDELVETTEDRILNDEIEQIIHFRNPAINTEVWFVAIGSDTDLHDGAKAFIEEHRGELRGSMIIELESLGAGVLSVASEEGRFRNTKTSSRMKRFTRGATEATGIALDQVKLNGTDSIASTMQRAGFQSMHLFGAEDGKPALKGSADDVIENVDELILEENVEFIMELLKHA